MYRNMKKRLIARGNTLIKKLPSTLLELQKRTIKAKENKKLIYLYRYFFSEHQF